ncbi:hypothetical protein FRC12_010528 [Ceratobasidium sp. 428]|nr:hypothetical protein FRC12_010528 [Ceratobasidium sp. 428]
MDTPTPIRPATNLRITGWTRAAGRSLVSSSIRRRFLPPGVINYMDTKVSLPQFCLYGKWFDIQFVNFIVDDTVAVNVAYIIHDKLLEHF